MSSAITILLVEDNPGDARLVQEMLADAHAPQRFQLAHVSYLSEALQYVKEGNIAAVLLDLSLPDGQGLEAVARIHAEAPQVPIVIMSGCDDEAMAIDGMREGAQDYLVKGRVDSDLLTRALRYAIERKRTEDRLTYLAHHDTLTDLPNRTLFHDRLQHTLALAHRHELPFALFFLDLDGFKEINDTLGHDKGDQLLQEVAARLIKCTRQSDTVARLGGDEFTVILPDVTHFNEAAIVARKILTVLQDPFSGVDNTLPITGSIGISLYPLSGHDADSLIKSADTAMYRAKEQGKNTFEFFTNDMHLQPNERISLKQDLRQALKRDQLLLHFQPLIELETGTFSTMKALIRWQHPEIGLISPAEFIPIAEETGLIQEINTWILREAGKHYAAWQEEGISLPRVAFRLSGYQFKNRNIVDEIMMLLVENRLDPHYVSLEIPEDVVMRNGEDAIGKLRGFKSLGIELTICDFGAAASPLRYLRRLPVDKLKIDRTFVQGLTGDKEGGLHHSSENVDVITAIVDLAHTFGLKVVATGVETEEQCALLRTVGCDQAQGPFLSPALEDSTLRKLLQQRSMR